MAYDLIIITFGFALELLYVEEDKLRVKVFSLIIWLLEDGLTPGGIFAVEQLT